MNKYTKRKSQESKEQKRIGVKRKHLYIFVVWISCMGQQYTCKRHNKPEKKKHIGSRKERERRMDKEQKEVDCSI